MVSVYLSNMTAIKQRDSFDSAARMIGFTNDQRKQIIDSVEKLAKEGKTDFGSIRIVPPHSEDGKPMSLGTWFHKEAEIFTDAKPNHPISLPLAKNASEADVRTVKDAARFFHALQVQQYDANGPLTPLFEPEVFNGYDLANQVEVKAFQIAMGMKPTGQIDNKFIETARGHCR